MIEQILSQLKEIFFELPFWILLVIGSFAYAGQKMYKLLYLTSSLALSSRWMFFYRIEGLLYLLILILSFIAALVKWGIPVAIITLIIFSLISNWISNMITRMVVESEDLDRGNLKVMTFYKFTTVSNWIALLLYLYTAYKLYH